MRRLRVSRAAPAKTAQIKVMRGSVAIPRNLPQSATASVRSDVDIVC
jgi:hypothetical protein